MMTIDYNKILNSIVKKANNGFNKNELIQFIDDKTNFNEIKRDIDLMNKERLFFRQYYELHTSFISILDSFENVIKSNDIYVCSYNSEKMIQAICTAKKYINDDNYEKVLVLFIRHYLTSKIDISNLSGNSIKFLMRKNIISKCKT